MNDEEVVNIPLCAYEAQTERFKRVIRCLAFSWAFSVIALSVVIACVMAA